MALIFFAECSFFAQEPLAISVVRNSHPTTPVSKFKAVNVGLSAIHCSMTMA